VSKPIWKIVLLAALVSASLVAVIWLPAVHPDGYLKAAYGKHRALLATPAPRLIFIGGSNLAFGLDSRKIQETTGLPVVNMGLHTELGLRYMINEVRPDIRPGDVVVVIQEYPFQLECAYTLLEHFLFFPQGIRYVDRATVLALLRQFPMTAQRRFEGVLRSHLLLHGAPLPPEFGYNASGFNEYGDNTGHLTRNNKVFPLTEMVIPEAVPETVAALNRFARELETRGARLLLSFPPCPQSCYTAEAARRGERLFRRIQEQGAFALLGRPADFVFTDSMFYDTVYHLNRTGRELRTRLLAGFLLQALASPRPEGPR